jgi:hypothetical protein
MSPNCLHCLLCIDGSKLKHVSDLSQHPVEEKTNIKKGKNKKACLVTMSNELVATQAKEILKAH